MAVILLMVLGLIALYSIALSQENPDFFIFKKQALLVKFVVLIKIESAVLYSGEIFLL